MEVIKFKEKWSCGAYFAQSKALDDFLLHLVKRVCWKQMLNINLMSVIFEHFSSPNFLGGPLLFRLAHMERPNSNTNCHKDRIISCWVRAEFDLEAQGRDLNISNVGLGQVTMLSSYWQKHSTPYGFYLFFFFALGSLDLILPQKITWWIGISQICIVGYFVL